MMVWFSSVTAFVVSSMLLRQTELTHLQAVNDQISGHSFLPSLAFQIAQSSGDAILKIEADSRQLEELDMAGVCDVWR